jgi:MarR family transcriptional regulator, organic hydroperoxide resistance regulator
MPDRSRSIAYLIHRIAMRIEDSINAKARKYRLRVGEIRVLMRILDHGDLTVGELAEATSIESSALSHLLRRLDGEKWVIRTRSANDNRQVLVSLTERGKAFATMLKPYIREYNEAAESGIRSEQLEVLYSQLETIYANIVRLEVSLHDFPAFDLKETKKTLNRRASRRLPRATRDSNLVESSRRISVR